MDINNRLNEIEDELKLLREHVKMSDDVYILDNDTNYLSIEYEYDQLFNLVSHEFIHLYIKDYRDDDSVAMSLTLQDAIDISSHLTKLINKYTLYRAEIRENC